MFDALLEVAIARVFEQRPHLGLEAVPSDAFERLGGCDDVERRIALELARDAHGAGDVGAEHLVHKRVHGGRG